MNEEYVPSPSTFLTCRPRAASSRNSIGEASRTVTPILIICVVVSCGALKLFISGD